jgi:hypothetical protein
MAEKLENIFKKSKPVKVKIGDKTVNGISDLAENSEKKILNITLKESTFDLLKETQAEEETVCVSISHVGNLIDIPTSVEINGKTYEVLSGRLIDENPSIEPFYQLEIKEN